jgi:hypothetical protein
MANEERSHPDRFTIELGKLNLSVEQTESLMNEIVRAAMARIKELGVRVQEFDRWISFDKWQSFGQHA